jgi:hypothetical protein
MATLPADPKGLELEDFVAAHFVSRGCYVETGIKERSPDELLELDIVWTDYRTVPHQRHPVEIKSGGWGVGDIFKFFGWTRYLDLEPGQFLYRMAYGRVDATTLDHLRAKTGIELLHVKNLEDADPLLGGLGLPAPSWSDLPQLWRYSFWAQRLLLGSLGRAIQQDICPNSAKTAKNFHHLINDAVFFIPDVRLRIEKLVTAHFEHQRLARGAAYEIQTGVEELIEPPKTKAFTNALYYGDHFPVQACLYLEHRARLYILKALVDYWLALDKDEVRNKSSRFVDAHLTAAQATAVEELAQSKSFKMFPLFWQVFLWSWGGFLLTDRLEGEYKQLASETGVAVEDIPTALTAFDKIHPTPGGWFRQPSNDSRRVLMLMPAAMRGIGAFRRKTQATVENYCALGLAEETPNRLQWDHNTVARLLDDGIK